MNTGLKTIDDLIQRFGIKTNESQDTFQQVMAWSGNDPRAAYFKLPFCFYQLITTMPATKNVTLHHFYLPHRKARLASFLIDANGKIIEQVFYQRDVKYVNACKKLQVMVQRAYSTSINIAA